MYVIYIIVINKFKINVYGFLKKWFFNQFYYNRVDLDLLI